MENTRSDSVKPREESDWHTRYSGKLNVEKPLRVFLRDPEDKNIDLIIQNDWAGRTKNYLESTNFPNPKASPTRSSILRKNASFCYDMEVSIPLPRDSYILKPEFGNQGKCRRLFTMTKLLSVYRDGGNLFGVTIGGNEPEVEYDMDEQDSAWLELVNRERVSKGLRGISDDIFEYLVDRFERAWYTLSRPLQRWTSRKLESKCADDLRCDVCGDGETVVNNLIVICESCDVAVHQDCYGVPLIPEGPWLCRKCYLDGFMACDCALCPWKGGAFKPTTDPSRPWCHLLCAQMLDNEVHILNPTYKEPLVIYGIHHERWNLACQICKLKDGAPTQCSVKSCHVALHPKCARKVGCHFDRSVQTLKCWKHSRSEILAVSPNHHFNSQPTVDFSDMKSISEDHGNSKFRKKIFQNPMVPKLVIDNLFYDDKLCQLPEKQRLAALELTSRYWSLKRSNRHGAPLIKSLQIEPWTSGGVLSNVKINLKRRRKLLRELESLELLTCIIYQYEKRKLGLLLIDEEIVELASYPFRTVLSILYRLLDMNHFFAEPVDSRLVPDYYDIIKRPMDLELIRKKLLTNQYGDFESFSNDIELIHSNAIMYNASETIYYTSAVEFIKKARPTLVQAAAILKQLKINYPSDTWPHPLKRLLPINVDATLSVKVEDPKNNNREIRKQPKLVDKRTSNNTNEHQISKRARIIGEMKERNNGNQFETINLVWAKLKGYPFYPARVVRLDEITAKEKRTIPKQILRQSKLRKSSLLVQFFDEQRAFSFVNPRYVEPLGSNFSKDFVNIVEKTFKVAPSTKADLRRAFKDAKKFIE